MITAAIFAPSAADIDESYYSQNGFRWQVVHSLELDTGYVRCALVGADVVMCRKPKALGAPPSQHKIRG